MDFLFVPLAASVGASADQVKLITCLLVSYPLGSVFVRIPSSRPALKHLFNLSISVFYFIPVLNLKSAFLQLLGDVLATYFVAARVKGYLMPWIVFTGLMGHLTVNHVLRAMSATGYETFEITGPQMVLVMKLTTFAWNVWDGRRRAEDLDKWQLQMRVAQFPSLLEFLGYAFYFPGVLVGPYLEYAAYTSLVNETLFRAYEGKPTDAPTKSRRAIPRGRKRVAYKKALFGLVFLGLYTTFSSSFNYGIAITNWFLKQNILYRILYIQFCGFIERTKYYGVWTLTEGASILTGLGFTGYSPSGKSLWDGAANVKIGLIEFPPNFKILLDSWNMKTNVWLRECVYKRVTPKGKKPGFKSSMITFATSAFWHGVAGGYYMTFLLGGFITTAGRLCRANIRPLVLAVPAQTQQHTSIPNGAPTKKPLPDDRPTTIKRLYDLSGIAVCILLVNYATIPFMLLHVKESTQAWTRLWWYGHCMVGSCLVFFYAGGGRWLKGIQAKRAQRTSSLTSSSSDTVDYLSTPFVPPIDPAVRELEKRLD